MSTKPKRIYQIDLFRFAAALSVLLYHYLFRGFSADNLSSVRFVEIAHFFKYGYLGVDIFFMISGFVIAMSIKGRSIKDFFISRVTRLYPAYWFCLLFTFSAMLIFGLPSYTVSFKEMLANLTMLHGFLKIKDVDGVYWSLLVELKFYLLIGFYLILNKFKSIKIDFVIYPWLALTIAYVFLSPLFVMKALNFFLFLNWSSYFIAGMILYEVYQSQWDLRKTAILFTCFLISCFQAVARIDWLESHYNTEFSATIICSFVALFYLLMSLVSSGYLRSINSPKLFYLGILTYPLYLIHQNVGYIIFNHLGGSINKYLLFISTTILMIVLSFGIVKLIERPIAAKMKSVLKNLFATPNSTER